MDFNPWAANELPPDMKARLLAFMQQGPAAPQPNAGGGLPPLAAMGAEAAPTPRAGPPRLPRAAAPPASPPLVSRETSVSTETAGGGNGGPVPGAPSALNASIANLNEKELDSLRQQGLSVDALRTQLGELQGQEMPWDLSALASLTDTWTGSNFAGNYKPQETAKDRRGAIEKLQAAISQGSNALSENEVSLLRSGLNNQFQLENLGYQRTKDSEKTAYQREQDKIQNALAGRRINADEANAAAMRDLRGDKQLEDGVKELQKRSGEMLPGMHDKLLKLDEILAKQGKDLPGVGTGDTWTPDFWLSRDGQNIRQLSEDLRADVIKMYSGTAASDKEVSKRAKAMGQSWVSDDAQFVSGLQFLRDSMAAKQQQVESAFPTQVRETFKARGGLTSDAVRQVPLETRAAAPAATPQAALSRAEKIKKLKELRGEK